jgi:hypothetical protein
MAYPKCSRANKPRFPNKLEADLVLASITLTNTRHRKGKYREAPTRSFPCEFCKGWHLTSQVRGRGLERESSN